MPALKCPNPSCPFLFDPAQVPPGALLTCPRCQLQFTLAVSEPPPFLPADAPRDAKAVTPSAAGFPLWKTAAGGALAVVLVVAAVLVLTVGRRAGRETATTGAGPKELGAPDKNFAFTVPAGWAVDRDAQNRIGANALGLRRADAPPAWVALSVIDYEGRAPSLSELRGEMMRSLNRVFKYLPAELPLTPTTWAGKPAQKAQFRGELKEGEQAAVGEAFLMQERGIGYWFYAWAAESDAAKVAAELNAARAGFRLLGNRSGWAAKTGGEAVYRSVQNNSRFRLSNYEPIWKPLDGIDPVSEHPAGELYLKGTIAGRGRRDFPPEALLLVCVLPADASAEAHVRARYTRDPEAFGPTAITPVTTPPAGDAPPGPEGGDESGVPATRWMVHVGGADASKVSDKLVVFASIKAGDKLIVADANCPWQQREAWERRLVQLVGSLREGGAK